MGSKGNADPLAFGADVLPSVESREDPSALAQSFVLTRLHARYTKETLGADLVFRAARRAPLVPVALPT